MSPLTTKDGASVYPSRIIRQVPKKRRAEAIQRGFIPADCERIEFRLALLSPFGAGPEPEALRLAALSAGRPGSSGLGRGIKRMVLGLQFLWFDRLLARNPDAGVLIWNGIKGYRRLMAEAAKARGRRVFYMEEAPLPGRITIDTEGVNYGSSLPRDPEFYLRWSRAEGIEAGAWRALRATIVPRQADRRDDVGQVDAADDLASKSFVFIPLQVPGDSQLTIYGDWMRRIEDMIDTLERVSSSLPEGWHLRIKEHPSSRVRFGKRLQALQNPKIVVDNQTNTMQQVAASRAVLTINSSVGLQAFFFDKPVIVLGKAFFDFGGMTHRARSEDDLRGLLSDPDALTFDQDVRDAFMNYLDREYYPTEADVVASRFSFAEVAARDARRDAVLAELAP